MCLEPKSVEVEGPWQWSGDRIIHRPIVPSGRPVAGARGAGSYPIDVREFLVTRHNAVLAQTLAEDLPAFLAQYGDDGAFFRSRAAGAFDHRAEALTAFVGQHVRYEKLARRDPWRFPDETLHLRRGDCEDIALLLASLMLASGVSAYCVRVALGQVARGGRRHDHVWVMYQDEAGRWRPLDPVLGPGAEVAGDEGALHYVPSFVFNDEHLWETGVSVDPAAFDAAKLATRWARFDPMFGGDVHHTIVNAAVGPLLRPEERWVMQRMNSQFTRVDGAHVEAVDADKLRYDPREHFDCCYVEEGWGLVHARLWAFSQNNVRGLEGFSRACHAIADWYAHTSWCHFAKIETAPMPHFALYDPRDPTSGLGRPIQYGAGSDFDLVSGRFTVNTRYWKRGHRAAAEHWDGKVISGRYGQLGDKPTRSKLSKFFVDAPDFPPRAAAPHHNEMAVDGTTPKREHLLYTPAEYARQFELRRNSAILHVRKAFRAGWRGPLREV